MSAQDRTEISKERREARRHPLALQLEVYLHSNVDPPGSMVFRLTDISLRGFRFNCDRALEVGSTFDFSILSRSPQGEALNLMRGTARTVRFDELPGGDFGIGAMIERAVDLDQRHFFDLVG